jgi:transcriptional regulator with XRE-family HTH domain
MLKQRLNRSRINEKLKSSGLNQSDIAKELDISRESVSKWFSEDCFPRPRHLLALSNFLDLDYSEVVIEEPDENEPVYAFRKVHDTVHSEEDVEKVKEIGYSLEKLIPFIKLNSFKTTLSNPKNNIFYISEIVKDLKIKFGIKSTLVEFEEIQKIFTGCNAFVIPVLWGESDNKTNSIHIHLPESMTDWIYINLDSFIYDYKFWMIHELSHLISSEIKDELESESFADNFAAEFLFPLNEAENFLNSLQSTSNSHILSRLFEKAVDLIVSPYTIYKQINKYLASVNHELIDIPKIVDTFKEKLSLEKNITLTQFFFNKKLPEPEEYVNLIEKYFSKDFISALKSYSINESFSVGFIQNIFHISLLDAKNIYSVIKARGLKNIGSAN